METILHTQPQLRLAHSGGHPSKLVALSLFLNVAFADGRLGSRLSFVCASPTRRGKDGVFLLLMYVAYFAASIPSFLLNGAPADGCMGQ